MPPPIASRISAKGLRGLRRQLPKYPLYQRHRRLRIGVDHAEQGSRRGVGGTAVLFPIPHGGDGDAQFDGEFCLAEFGLGANGPFD